MGPQKRLYKVEEGKKIAGVCGGFAKYFNIDPTLVRIGWIVFSVCFGSGLVAYVLAAIVMPSEYDVQ